jgi:hypothetical protein
MPMAVPMRLASASVNLCVETVIVLLSVGSSSPARGADRIGEYADGAP